MSDAPIGALAVRIGADATDLVREFGRAGKASDKLDSDLVRMKRSLLEVGAALGVAGGAVFALTAKLADQADEAGKTAQKVGMAVEAYSSLAYAARIANVSQEQLTGGLKQLQKFMVENRVEGVSVEEQLLRIADSFAQAGTEEMKAAVAMKYFGKSGADLIPLLNEGRAGIEALRKEAERLGVVITQQDVEAAEKFNDSLTRMKAMSEGVARDIGGPLVKALGDSAEAFLKARTEGESFFESVKRGIQELLTGSDSDKLNKQIIDAAEEVRRLEDELDGARNKARNRGGPFAELEVKRFTRELAEARAEYEKLVALKPVLAPEQEAKPKPTGTLPMPEDQGKAQRDAEMIARQLQEQAEEEIRIRSEVAQLMTNQRALEQAEALESKRLFHELDLAGDEEFTLEQLRQMKAAQDARLKILMEGHDREQEQEILRGEELLRIERELQDNLTAAGYRHREMNLSSAKTFFGQMSQLMQTNSKKQFEIGKAAAIAETVINTYNAAVGAYKAMASIPYVGPALGAAAAAAAIAFGTAQVNNIRKQQFGGGGGVTPVVASNPSTGAPQGTPGDVGGGARGPDTFIHLGAGDMYSRANVRQLLKHFEEEGRDGGRVVVVEDR